MTNRKPEPGNLEDSVLGSMNYRVFDELAEEVINPVCSLIPRDFLTYEIQSRVSNPEVYLRCTTLLRMIRQKIDGV